MALLAVNPRQQIDVYTSTRRSVEGLSGRKSDVYQTSIRYLYTSIRHILDVYVYGW